MVGMSRERMASSSTLCSTFLMIFRAVKGWLSLTRWEICHVDSQKSVLWIQIRRFLGLPDPDPSLFVWIRILSSLSKKRKKKMISTFL
jgi:hypothetical protein